MMGHQAAAAVQCQLRLLCALECHVMFGCGVRTVHVLADELSRRSNIVYRSACCHGVCCQRSAGCDVSFCRDIKLRDAAVCDSWQGLYAAWYPPCLFGRWMTCRSARFAAATGPLFEPRAMHVLDPDLCWPRFRVAEMLLLWSTAVLSVQPVVSLA